jgi:hypothetical protein
MPDDVRLVVTEVRLEQALLRLLQFSPVIIILQVLLAHTFFHYGRYTYNASNWRRPSVAHLKYGLQNCSVNCQPAGKEMCRATAI